MDSDLRLDEIKCGSASEVCPNFSIDCWGAAKQVEADQHKIMMAVRYSSRSSRFVYSHA